MTHVQRLWLALLLIGAPGQAQHPVATWYHQDCDTCHTPHKATPNATMPLQRSTNDATCLSCHPATTTTPTAPMAPAAPTPPTVVSRFLAMARSLGLAPAPSPAPSPGLAPPVPFGGSSHLTPRPGSPAAKYQRVVGRGSARTVLRMSCTGCHDPHARGPLKLRAQAFDSRGQLLLGARAANAAQVCFGCHAGPEAARFPDAEADVGRRFSPGVGSSHSIGKSAADRPDLPSLRGGLFRDRLDCTSCHADPDSTGLRGPHTSRFPALLKAAYGKEGDSALRGGRPNDLCYTCHDQASIEGNRSFPFHREHITGFTGGLRPLPTVPMPFRTPQQVRTGRPGLPFAGVGEPTPCATCHDPHGSTTFPALIAFDPRVVTRSSVGGVDFYRSGLGHGTCTLSCHGYDHVQTQY